jgi:hypothetical protein
MMMSSLVLMALPALFSLFNELKPRRSCARQHARRHSTLTGLNLALCREEAKEKQRLKCVLGVVDAKVD